MQRITCELMVEQGVEALTKKEKLLRNTKDGKFWRTMIAYILKGCITKKDIFQSDNSHLISIFFLLCVRAAIQKKKKQIFPIEVKIKLQKYKHFVLRTEKTKETLYFEFHNI